MKRITIVLLIAIILTAFVTSCNTANSGRSKDEIQEEFNQTAIYFIKTDGPKLITYEEKDQTITNRERQTVKRRYNNLISLINQMEVE